MLVEQAIDIGTGIDRQPVDLFWSHVFCRANHLINTGERRIHSHVSRRRREYGFLAAAVEQLGDTKVREQQFMAVTCGDEHILRLHVAMHDATLVSMM